MEWTLVTGGAKRLGAAICKELALQGHSIILHYHTSKKEAQSVARHCTKLGFRVELIQGDFSTKESLEHFIQKCSKRFSSIKYLVNNVGSYLSKKASDTSLDEWVHAIQTNLNTPFALSRAFLPNIIKLSGSILNVGVVGIAHMRVDVEHAAYKIAKTGLYMLTRTLARELAPKGVSVNMVSPGYIENAVDLPKELQKIPMGRPATIEEVVRVISFLLNPKNRYITGQNIEIGGALGI